MNEGIVGEESVASGRQARRTERRNRSWLQANEDSEHRATTHGVRAVALFLYDSEQVVFFHY